MSLKIKTQQKQHTKKGIPPSKGIIAALLTTKPHMRHECLMTNTIRPDTQTAILEAAFEVLNRAPNASIAEIATRAGVGRATLHRHFATRNELLRALTLQALHEIDEAADQAAQKAKDNADAMRLVLEAIIPLGDRHGFLASALIDDDPELNGHFERQHQETLDMIEAAKAEGAFDPFVPTEWIAQTYDHLIYAGWESVRAQQTTPTQAARLAWRTLINGLGV